MAINGISNTNNAQRGFETVGTARNAAKEQLNGNNHGTKAGSPASVFEKTNKYGIGSETVQKLLAGGKDQTAAFRDFLTRVFGTQAEKYGNFTGVGIGANGGVEADEATRKQAEADIAEDGYYGVKATSERILDFAKALSGGDQSKIATLRKAVDDGFKEAQRVWGGELPQISKDTYDAVMKGFDEWEASFKTEEEVAPVK